MSSVSTKDKQYQNEVFEGWDTTDKKSEIICDLNS